MAIDNEKTAQTTLSAVGLAKKPKPQISLIFYHRDGSQIVSLSDGDDVVVGRGVPSDVLIADRSLSRQHAGFTFSKDKIWVTDLNSTNGTRINGKAISGRKPIKPNDEVRLGSVIATCHRTPLNDMSLSGLIGHDFFVSRLEEEVLRARTFRRKIAVLMIRAASRRKDSHLSHWAPNVKTNIRSVDLAALYGPQAILVCMPETGAIEALSAADAIIALPSSREVPLCCGISTFPESAASAEELIEAARTAVHRCSAKCPVYTAQTIGNEVDTTAKVDDLNAGPVLSSDKLRDVYALADRIAKSTIPVLIHGETGTGKEILARHIHDVCDRKSKPFRCINCGAIPEQLVESVLFGHEQGAFTGASQRAKGAFEDSDGGTVLLDEVGELSSSAQIALLRVIETKRICRVGSNKEIPVDVRVLAATHRDLESMCQRGEFRSDLYFRLNSMVIQIPPLRDRREDIIPLAEHFMRLACKATGCRVKTIDPAAQKLLIRHDWPGNVRELRNVIERAVVIAEDETIIVDDLSEKIRTVIERTPSHIRPTINMQSEAHLSIKERLQHYEAQLLLEALDGYDWNQTETADSLNMPLRTLVHKIKQYDLKRHTSETTK